MWINLFQQANEKINKKSCGKPDSRAAPRYRFKYCQNIAKVMLVQVLLLLRSSTHTHTHPTDTHTHTTDTHTHTPQTHTHTHTTDTHTHTHTHTHWALPSKLSACKTPLEGLAMARMQDCSSGHSRSEQSGAIPQVSCNLGSQWFALVA